MNEALQWSLVTASLTTCILSLPGLAMVKESYVGLILTHHINVPVGGIRSTWKKSTTSSSALTNSFHISVMNLKGRSNLRSQR